MKILYLNIYEGCKDPARFNKIIRFINKTKPDVLGLSELNGWDLNNQAKFKYFKSKAGFKYSLFGKTKTGYHLGLFSKYPLINESFAQKGFHHGLLTAGIKYKNQNTKILLTHLDPNRESARLKEAKILKDVVRNTNRHLLMGDFNSLSRKDKYDKVKLLKIFKSIGLKKFGTNRIQSNVIEQFYKMDLVDAVRKFSKKFEYSVPTTFNQDWEHATKLRLDYIFVSKTLAPAIKSARILRTKETNALSDHFPVLLELGE